MQMNLTTDYAVKIIIFLAQKKSPVTSKEISREIGVSPEFAQNIIRKMKNAKGLVHVKRGMFGGYTLAKRPEDIKLSDIFEAMDDDVVIDRQSDEKTSISDLAPETYDKKGNITKYYSRLQDVMEKALSVSIKEVAEGDF